MFLFIALFLVAGMLCAALPKNHILRLLVIVCTAFLVMAEITSVLFGNGYADYQFYVNIDFNNLISGLMIFPVQIVTVALIFVAMIVLLYRLARWLHRRFRTRVLLPLLLVTGSCLYLPSGPMPKLYEIYAVVTSSESDLNRALLQLEIDPALYVQKKDITATKGKNIIVMSLESLEQNFMSPALASLTPNLQALASRYTFFNQMPVGVGSSWTVASMYTYMTGMPLLVGGYQTNSFAGVKSTSMTNLGYILQQAGYKTVYTLGLPDFSGMGDAARLFGIRVVSEQTYPNRYPEAPFGLYDKDVFDLAKTELTPLIEENKPFALFLSTVSTHAPNGFVDSRMKGVIPALDDDFEFSVASLDYNLGQFMDYLAKSGVLDNTVFYIFPDHTVMGYGTSVLKKLSREPRQLFMITNAKAPELGKAPDEKIYQIDLPRLILNGAEIKTNATFLTDFIPAQDKLQFIETHKRGVAAINSASLHR